MAEYNLNDLLGEFSVLCRSIIKKMDVVHFIDAEHSLMFLPSWYEKLKNLKTFPRVVAMFHQPPSILESLINIEIVKQVDHVLVVSPIQVDYFKQYLSPKQITSILLGVDTAYFKPSPQKKSKTFKCLGGGIWLRDYNALFKTAKLLENISEIEFHIVAPSRNNPWGKKQQLKNIIFHENIPDPELLELYQSCNILFLPLEDATANTFLLEGSSCGLPVVSSNLVSIKTYFPGEEAILVKDNNPNVYSEIIRDLYKNPRRVAEMSKKARKRAEDLSWSRIVQDYEQLYLNLR